MGTPEAHGRIRGQRSVQEIEEALKALKESGIKVWTTTVLTRFKRAIILRKLLNLHAGNNIIANFTRLEFFTEAPNHLHPMAEDVEDLILKGEEREAVFQKLIELKRSGAPDRLNPFLT